MTSAPCVQILNKACGRLTPVSERNWKWRRWWRAAAPNSQGRKILIFWSPESEVEIYGGAQRALREQLWNLPESGKSVLLIGHNPALHDRARELAHADLTPPVRDGGALCAIVAAV